MTFMPGMQQQTIRANGVRINVWVGGKGDPVVLLHGYPQTGQMWRKVVPGLLDKFTVVCPDLRGYGDSDKPRDGYDKRSMAKDISEVMFALGFKSYSVVGHDRGARVAHRLAMDYRDQVRNLTVLDIVPTHTVFRDTGKELAAAYWHWFFFQVPDLPEIMMANSAEPFCGTCSGRCAFARTPSRNRCSRNTCAPSSCPGRSARDLRTIARRRPWILPTTSATWEKSSPARYW